MYVLLKLDEGFLQELSIMIQSNTITGTFVPNIDAIDKLAGAVALSCSDNYVRNEYTARANDGSVRAIAGRTYDSARLGTIGIREWE